MPALPRRRRRASRLVIAAGAGLIAGIATALLGVAGPAAPASPADPILTATNTTTAEVDDETALRSLAFPGANGTVTDVDVSIALRRSAGGCPATDGENFPDEMYYRLSSPSGTTVKLVRTYAAFEGSGAPTYDHYLDSSRDSGLRTVTFDDKAASAAGAEFVSGTFQPAEPLTAFDGEPVGGPWTLLIGDDGGGNATCHEAFTLTVTAAPPSAPSIVVDGGPADGATVTEAPTYRFYSTGGGSKDCRVDGGPWEQCASPYTVPIDGLGDGPHTVEFRAIGSDGSLSDPVKRTFVLDAVPDDTTGPSVTIDSGPADGVTVDESPSYGFSSPDDDVAGYECSADAAAYAACESPFTPAVTEPGAHSVAVRATDTSGNTGQAVTRTFTLRNVACNDATAALEAAQADLADARADVQVAKEKLRKARESGNPVRIDRAKERLATAKEVRGQAKAAVAAAQADVDDAC